MDGIAINNRKYNAMTLLSATTVDETISPGVLIWNLRPQNSLPTNVTSSHHCPYF